MHMQMKELHLHLYHALSASVLHPLLSKTNMAQKYSHASCTTMSPMHAQGQDAALLRPANSPLTVRMYLRMQTCRSVCVCANVRMACHAHVACGAGV